MLSSKFKTLCFTKNVNVSAIATTFRFPKSSYTSKSIIVQSKIPKIDIPNILIDEYLWKDLEKWHDKTFVECAETGRSYLFSEVYQKSKVLANFLNKFPNLNQNDTVAIILPNIPEFPIILLGAIQAGLKVTPINWINTPDEITKQLISAQAKLVFTLTDLYSKVNQAITQTNANIPLVAVNHRQNQSAPADAIKFNEIINGEHELQFQISQGMDDVILLPYSSGTTGVPKGVELTNRNIVSNLYQMGTSAFAHTRKTEGSDQEVIPAVLPWFHIYGLIIVLLNSISLGSKLVTIPKFGPQIFLNVLKEHKPTFMYLVPPIVLFLSNSPEVLPKYLSKTRAIVSGAAPIGTSDLKKLQEKTKGKLKILQAYGLTEASPLTHTQTLQLENGVKEGSIGFSLPNTECKVVNVDDEAKIGLGPNQPGELLIRGPQVMKGYYKNVNATQDVLDSDGWLRTGDIVHYDVDEHFYVTDRLKELIKVKGFQVAPAELEALLRTYPDIEDAAVIGVPHEAFGEVPKAFVVPKQNTRFNSANVHEYIAVKAAKYKQLVGGIVVVDSIPRSQAGKILRRQLK